jgi:hypothetical protein
MLSPAEPNLGSRPVGPRAGRRQYSMEPSSTSSNFAQLWPSIVEPYCRLPRRIRHPLPRTSLRFFRGIVSTVRRQALRRELDATATSWERQRAPIQADIRRFEEDSGQRRVCHLAASPGGGREAFSSAHIRACSACGEHWELRRAATQFLCHFCARPLRHLECAAGQKRPRTDGDRSRHTRNRRAGSGLGTAKSPRHGRSQRSHPDG